MRYFCGSATSARLIHRRCLNHPGNRIVGPFILKRRDSRSFEARTEFLNTFHGILEKLSPLVRNVKRQLRSANRECNDRQSYGVPHSQLVHHIGIELGKNGHNQGIVQQVRDDLAGDRPLRGDFVRYLHSKPEPFHHRTNDRVDETLRATAHERVRIADGGDDEAHPFLSVVLVGNGRLSRVC